MTAWQSVHESMKAFTWISCDSCGSVIIACPVIGSYISISTNYDVLFFGDVLGRLVEGLGIFLNDVWGGLGDMFGSCVSVFLRGVRCV